MAEMMHDPLQIDIFARRRIRLVRQDEIAECGLACLAMVARYHGHDVDIAIMRRRFPPSGRGITLSGLMEVADRLGLDPRPVKVGLDGLPRLRLPAVLHWDMNHFVVLERIARRGALIHNPVGRSRWMPMEDVSRHFTGVALELTPGSRFQPETERGTARWSDLWGRLRGLVPTLLQVLILSLVLQAYVLALPYFLQLALDSVVPAGDFDLLVVLFIGFGLFTLLNAGGTALRSFVLLAAGAQVGFGLSSNVARRLFRLPVGWFTRRRTGDILARFQSVEPIREALTQGLAAAMIDGLLALTTLALMFVYSPKLTFVAIASLVLYLIVRAISFPMERRAEEDAIIAGGRKQTTLIETLQGISTLRLFNREMLRYTVWKGRLADEVNAQLRIGRIGVWQRTANTLIFGLENVLTIYLAVRAVLEGGFTVGMVFAYLAYKDQFLDRAAGLVDQIIAFSMLRLHLLRLSDITAAEEDISFMNDEVRTTLEGGIELRDVIYRHSPTDPIVLTGVNLKVEPGEHVAITGPSGAGKSTLLRVMIGLIEPNSGIVLIDGIPLRRFGHRSLHDQSATVLQDDVLFTGSIAENIALFDETPDADRIMRSAEMAAVHDEIMAMPMRYETMVGDLGTAMSGGQKQRVLLARALYRNPRILFIDEGTSHLDTENETRVNMAIARLGITRIVVAHRQETVNAADRVIVMEAGRIVLRDNKGETPRQSG
jgi:ATP-binding cassette subfamily B protein RaxB